MVDSVDSKEVLQILTRECRDLIDSLADTHPTIAALTPEERSEIVRQHFALDMSGYGIPVEEWLPGITEESRIEIVNETLSHPEYAS